PSPTMAESPSGFSPEQIQILQQLIKDGLAAVQGSTPPPGGQKPPGPSGQDSSGYIGPLTGNQAAGASPSQTLLSAFPEIEAATITTIIQHEFRACDLYKLDSRYRDKSEKQVLSLEGKTLELTTNDSAYKDYKTLNSIVVPLETYFSILISHVCHATTNLGLAPVAVDFFKYTAHIVKIAAEFDWNAVVRYHMAFFNKRRREMQAGYYNGWGKQDSDLLHEHIYGAGRLITVSTPSKYSKKSSIPLNRSEPCRNFNTGKCTTSPCAYGRPHICSTCSKADHGAHKCPSSSTKS
ncbi:hypothetical protein AAF712_016775, partial [Marasmius tenuissimus]